MKVTFTLREDKTDRTGLAPVFVCVSFDGLRLQTTTKEKCRPADWNRDKQQFRRSLPGYQDANAYLENLTLRLHARYRELRTAGTAPTPALLREAVHPVAEVAPPAEPTLVELFDQYREVLRGRGFAFNTLRHYGTARNWLQKFEQHRSKKAFYLADYTLTRHDELIHFLRLTHGLGPNGIFSILKDVKKFLRHLQQERGLELALDLSRMQVRWTEAPKHFLSAADLMALATTIVPDTLLPVRDVFLFCCYTGLRYSDVQQLQPANLHTWNGHRILKLVQTKTRRPVSIYLTAAAEAILNQYANTERLRLLPVYANQVMNRGLKRLGQLAGLVTPVETMEVVSGQVVKTSVPAYELLTMHTARHTFATQSLLRGVSPAVLQRVMGHSKLQTTMHYAKMVEDFQHQALQLAWDGPATTANTPLVAGEVCVAATAA
ncbi:site-specific integrase [Hymenobacter glacieicola]|uniref:Tyrosine recombinase n=1 Tax=Hymenobacter glacieicola TaxID=1562124 RepID=A0ABQ1WKQ8_9BACT|nr:site-specific integrase [Hymenobacter glacieicola]GGG35364.1 tyrosine recombinase [Hymenobacter glacieicola]